jgi:pyrroloquinoline quinone biosynthesis protein D
MTAVQLHARPALSPLYRLQFEAVQDSWVLLYPEGMVKLNGPASEILKRCSGDVTVQGLIDDLQTTFGESDLKADVLAFLSDAYDRGWLR